MTEFLMQMTPPSYTELITVKKSDKDMFKQINELLKVGLCLCSEDQVKAICG
jgi:hypothetical protein